ncbi:MAG: DUF5996 family protein [Actinomycetales bacterium]|nr:DUF5996 family protein [Leifsonia sp.]
MPFSERRSPPAVPDSPARVLSAAHVRYPAPELFRTVKVPDGAFYSDEYGEFLLPYETVRRSDDPDQLVLEFLRDTYRGAADLAQWPDPPRFSEDTFTHQGQ